MTTFNHTPYPLGMNATAANFNAALEQLDEAIGLHNRTATTDPGVSNDSSQGYEAGRSIWLNTVSSTVFICVSDAVGAAVWQDVSTLQIDPGDMPSATTDDQGAVELATNAEAQAGTDTTRAVTPAGLAAAISDILSGGNFVVTSAGPSNSGDGVLLDVNGKLDISLLDSADIYEFMRIVLSQPGDLLVRNDVGSLVRLPIGGDGQVLAVNSAQSTRLNWTAPVTSGSGIPVGTVNARGDLIAGTADDTVDRLAVGLSGYVLTADTSAPTGLSWQNRATYRLIGTHSGYLPSMPLTFTNSPATIGIEPLKIVGQFQVAGSGTANIFLRVNNVSAGYTWNMTTNNGSTVVASQDFGDATYIPIALSVNQGTGNHAIFLDVEITGNAFQASPYGGIVVKIKSEVYLSGTSFTAHQIRGLLPAADSTLPVSLTQVSIVSSATSSLTGEIGAYRIQ